MNELDVFTAALELADLAARARFLDEACGGHPELRSRIDALLRNASDASRYLESPPHAILATIDHSPSEQPGTLIGRYKLLEQVGEGGMGVVYVAEQTEPVRRRVALKIIKPGMDTKQVIARFEAERQALAMMDHPNIARVLDAGTTEAGRPYFVMELVRGMPITEYCDKTRLSPRQRLELFVDVCQAVQHAHQKGIIHRDLKPSNVMVTLHDGTPVVKVIDFGVAKAVGHQLTERTVYTALTQLVGTPLYMSPEQAEMSGLDVDTRSDVYSLGVLLYELLTGQTPFDKETLSKAGLDEMRRIIREDEPLRPSRRFSTLGAAAISTASQHRGVDERRLSKILCGELDWIVMKALEKDRSRRYESASTLAADVQRYLSDEPVLACPPTAMYRFQKFARKHKPALATAAAIAACLILGTTVSAWQAIRATQAEDQAAANEAQAQASAQEAKQQAQQASAQRNEAQQQRDEAQRQRDEVKALADKLNRTLYAAHMNLAQNALGEQGGIARFDELLAQHRPKPGEADLRGFEWYYLYRQAHEEILTIRRFGQGSTADHNLSFSPDGKRLASGSWDKTAKQGIVEIWDAQTGEKIITCKGPAHPVNSIAFSPDGKRLASGGGGWYEANKAPEAGEVIVWDLQTGQELLSLQGHTLSVNSVAFSPDGKRLVSGSGAFGVSRPGELKVWDTQNGQELFSCEGPIAGVLSVAFSPDGKRLASAHQLSASKMWDAQTGKELPTLNYGGRSVAFSPDGKRLATGGRGLKVRDAETGQELLSIAGGATVAFGADGKRVAGGSQSAVKMWDAETGEELANFKGHSGAINSVAFSPDGRRLASASGDGTVKLWDVTAGPLTRNFAQTGRGTGVGVAYSPDGKRVASAGSSTWDNTKNAYGPGEVKVLDAETGQELLSVKGHSTIVYGVAFSPDGKRLASASADKTVKVWDARTGQELLTFKGHTGRVLSVAYSPDGTRLASTTGWGRYQNVATSNFSAGSDPGEPGEVIVWDSLTGRELLNLKGHGRSVHCVVFSPDGKRLATCSRDNTVKIWNAQTGQTILTLKANAFNFGSLAFSPDGKRLASTDGNAVKVWDAETGEELLSFKGHTSGIDSIVFSPDGNRVASGASRTVKVWDSQTGEELLTLKRQSGDSLAFSQDGHHLASNRDNGTVTIWDAPPLPEKP